MTIEQIEDILLSISYKKEDEKTAKDSFVTLYHGYSVFLSNVVSRVLKDRSIYDMQIVNTIINNTFFKLYEDPMRFSFPKDAKDDKPFKAWLSKVAKIDLKNQLLEYYLDKESGDLETLRSDLYIESGELSEKIYNNTNAKVLEEALQSLNERDREILLTLYMYHEDGKYTPSSVIEMLCKRYDTTPVNIRKIKQRSTEKIEAYISQKTQLTPLKHVKK